MRQVAGWICASIGFGVSGATVGKLIEFCQQSMPIAQFGVYFFTGLGAAFSLFVAIHKWLRLQGEISDLRKENARLSSLFGRAPTDNVRDMIDE